MEELISTKYFRIIWVWAFALLLSRSSAYLGNVDEEEKYLEIWEKIPHKVTMFQKSFV